MIYKYADNIPKNITEVNARRLDMSLCRGIIHRVEVQFPVGCAEVAHGCIYNASHQVWPSNPSESFASDGYVISFDETYELLHPPFQLTLVTWNTSDTYSHKITVRLGILPKKAVLSYIVPAAFNLFLKKGG